MRSSIPTLPIRTFSGTSPKAIRYRIFLNSSTTCHVLAVSPAFALTDEEVFRNFRFNLINPGARSLAMGGAFISLADDATAAQANPAGLGFLTRWEFFAEVRSINNAAQASIHSIPGMFPLVWGPTTVSARKPAPLILPRAADPERATDRTMATSKAAAVRNVLVIIAMSPCVICVA